VLNSVEESRPDPDPEDRAALIEGMAAHPNLRRVAPAFARQNAQEVFELGVEVVLDGLTARAARRRHE
jgi:TetR/AcrR family tetracycline transcriptional repressor